MITFGVLDTLVGSLTHLFVYIFNANNNNYDNRDAMILINFVLMVLMYAIC